MRLFCELLAGFIFLCCLVFYYLFVALVYLVIGVIALLVLGFSLIFRKLYHGKHRWEDIKPDE